MGRTGNIGERGHLARVIDPYLHYCYLMLVSETQESERHAEVVIEVSLCIEDFVPLRENSSAELLRRGLTVAPCDSDQWYPEALPVSLGELLQCEECILGVDAALVTLGEGRI